MDKNKSDYSVPYFEKPCMDGIHDYEEVCVGNVMDEFYVVFRCLDCGIEEEKFIDREMYEHYKDNLGHCE